MSDDPREKELDLVIAFIRRLIDDDNTSHQQAYILKDLVDSLERAEHLLPPPNPREEDRRTG